MSDKKYLFKRNNVWWVKLAVPLSLRSELGYDLRRTTGEKDLDKAIPIRDKIIEEFKTEFQIRKVNADDKGISFEELSICKKLIFLIRNIFIR